MPTTTAAIAERSQAIADDVLFPAALDTDAAALLPAHLLDVLADAGLYGLVAPGEVGGLAAIGEPVRMAVVEALASGCLTTTFVWQQHHASVGAIASWAPAAMRDEWLRPLCTGERRAGVAFAHLRRPGPPSMTAAADGDGWVLDGTAPWVSGWGRIDVVHVAATIADGRIAWALIDAVEGPTVAAAALRLAAMQATGTVELALTRHRVPAARVVLVEPLETWSARDAAGLRTNGALALGVTSRCCRLLGPSDLDSDLEVARARLATVDAAALPEVRADVTALAVRAAAALLARHGGRGMTLGDHAQRLAREALFLVVQGQTPAIRAAQAAAFGAAAREPTARTTAAITPAPAGWATRPS